MFEKRPQLDEYLGDQMDAKHLSPRLIIEKKLMPSLTVWVAADGKWAKFQRWYDVQPAILEGVGVRSVSYFPDSIVRLIDKDGNAIHSIPAKLTDEFDGLPLLLARLAKTWSFAASASEFWSQACHIIARSDVPTLKEIASGSPILDRMGWLELACFWIAFMANVRYKSGESEWASLVSGEDLISKYIDFYNEYPGRLPSQREPRYDGDRVRLASLLNAVREAKTKQEKKKSLETLAEEFLRGVPGFEVLPPQMAATGEIDRVVRNTSLHPHINRLGPWILVECKNWSKTVGTDQLGSFINDLRNARMTCGFLFIRKPLSNPAKQQIKNFFQRNHGFIVTITEKDIQAVCDGANFSQWLIEQAENIVFQR